jgi:hypothetical protein
MSLKQARTRAEETVGLPSRTIPHRRYPASSISQASIGILINGTTDTPDPAGGALNEADYDASAEVPDPRLRRNCGKGRRRPITERLDARKNVGGNKYNFHEPTYLPGGKVLMCAKGFHSATYCN